MITAFEKQLKMFVDRKDEMKLFREILETGDPPIMVVCGEDGVGKSMLMAKMVHECALKKLPKAEIVWTETRNHDFLAVMRKIRDDVGPEHFNPFTDLVNYYTVPKYELKIKVEGSIHVAENATIQGSTTGDITGIKIQDMMIPEPREDLAISRDQKMMVLSDKFLENFASALDKMESERPLVVFLDSIEKMSEETHHWVVNELLGNLSKGHLKNIRFVLCGDTFPKDNLETGLQMMIEVAELKSLDRGYIVEYLEKRGIEESAREDLALMLEVSTNGNLQKIALTVDAFLKKKQRESRE